MLYLLRPTILILSQVGLVMRFVNKRKRLNRVLDEEDKKYIQNLFIGVSEHNKNSPQNKIELSEIVDSIENELNVKLSLSEFLKIVGK